MEMKQLLQRVDYFKGLDGKALDRLADAAILRNYPAGEVIVKQGETGLGLYVITRGRVRVEKEMPNGQPPLKLNELPTKETSAFAEMAVIDNQPRSATVRSIEETECILLTRDSMTKLMQKYPEIAVGIARDLAQKLRAANDLLAATGQKGNAPAPAAGAAPPSPAPPPAAEGTTDAPKAESNGNAPAEGFKASAQKTLLSVFDRLYTMKALTKFSVAVIGCPVEGVAADSIGEIRLGEVKAVILPSRSKTGLRLQALESGEFTLDVLRPEGGGPIRFGPMPLDPGEDCRLDLSSGEPMLYRNGIPAGGR
ncbi:MAG: cyclic nucleotide-binding domain-containing protein [Acidobacteria bacterium]|nr:cyclic nucleotide-binding domain-containing protein [Acidobacteriota bacterium]